ncbi:MAG TPA: DUF3501 family protein [Acidimicrobiia bacterium]
MAVRKVTVDDIPELRAYQKQRAELREQVIALKSRRRIHLGTIVTIAFENVDTITWQISEMVRAERIITEEGVAEEVAIYNDLVPDENQLSITLFIELTDDEGMREWLPKLVGIHEAIEIRVPGCDPVRGYDPKAERLTRDEVTSAVHYLKFDFSPEQIAAFRRGPVTVASTHPAYLESIELTQEQQEEIAHDFD